MPATALTSGAWLREPPQKDVGSYLPLNCTRTYAYVRILTTPGAEPLFVRDFSSAREHSNGMALT